MVANLKYFLHLIKVGVLSAISLKASFIMKVIFMCVNNLLTLVAWWILFNKFENINGWSLGHFLLMFGMIATSFGIISTFMKGAGFLTAKYIENGFLDTFLIQPKNIIFSLAFSKNEPSGLGDILSGFIMLYWSGLVSLTTLPLIVLSMLCSFILMLSTLFLIQCIPFYFNNSANMANRIFHIFLSFCTHPGCIYDGVLRVILLTIIPAGVICILPIQLLIDFSFIDLAMLISIPSALFTLSIWLFYHGLKRYESGNRFGVHF